MTTSGSGILMASLALAALPALAGAQEQRASAETDEVRAVVAEMVADAQSRTSLLAGGNAGHDGKFFLASDDGAFRLNITGNIQFRYIADFRDSDNTVGSAAGDEFVSGFQTRRTKLYFTGNISKDWFFELETNFDRGGSGNLGLDGAYVGYNFGNGWKARWGQFKLPFSREELVSDRYQLAVERSVANAIFTQDYSQGMEVSYSAEQWRMMLAFSDGFGSKNTDFTAASEADFGLTGRFEYKLAGDKFDTFYEFTSAQGSPFASLLGAAIHYQQSANTNAPTDVDVGYLSYTADLSFKGDGWNAYVAGYGRHLDTRGPVGATSSPDFDDFGAVAQFGWRFAKNTEAFARYDGVFLDSDRFTSGEDSFNFLTAGLVEYYAGHAAKATMDVVYAFNETTNLAGARGLPQAGFPSSGLGLLGDSKDGEVCIRLQFQLLF